LNDEKYQIFGTKLVEKFTVRTEIRLKRGFRCAEREIFRKTREEFAE
jgi:hypothetical protein